MEAKGKPGRMARRPSLCYGGSHMTDSPTWGRVGNAWVLRHLHVILLYIVVWVKPIYGWNPTSPALKLTSEVILNKNNDDILLV